MQLDYDHPLFHEFVRLFNAEMFFESHEALESLWRQNGAVRGGVYQALIQLAVALEHLKRGNLKGADSVFRRASGGLAGYSESTLNLADVLIQTQQCMTEMDATGRHGLFPKLIVGTV